MSRRIIVPGDPIAKRRPRFYRKGKHVGTYNDQGTEEGRFLLLASQRLPAEPLSGAVAIHCLFVFRRPKSHYGTGRNSGKLKPGAPARHTKKPDLDNLVKFIKDALNGVAWHDDAQVVDVSATKRYGDRPRTEIFIKPLDGG